MANCWTRRGTISDHGCADDVRVKPVEGCVSAFHLKGGAYGGLSASATCRRRAGPRPAR
ncbi:hypothetical protein [Streptomyces tendae]